MLKRVVHHCLLLMVLGPLGAQAQVSTSFGQLFHSKFVELCQTGNETVPTQ
jgi:hypothetical protein